MRHTVTLSFLLMLLGLTGVYTQSGIIGTPGQVPRADVVDLKNTEVGLMPTMANEREIHSPKMKAIREEVRAIKARKARILDSLSQDDPGSVTRNPVPEPDFINGFEANEPAGTPNDNDFAISPNGYVVSGTNSIIRVYDLNGRELLRRGLSALGGAADTIRRPFDPRVLYDPEDDRFIVVYDNGSSADPPRNDLVLCFSQTGDPTGLWNTYAVKGNLRPSGTNVWMDYPQVAISKDELFMTGNLFGARGGVGVGIWQCDLSDGYNGNPLDFVSYVDQSIFSLTPVQGVPDLHGPGMTFITKTFSPGRRFFLYEIPNTLTSGQAVFRPLTVMSGQDRYSISPDARQPGSQAPDGSDRLDSGDGRIQYAIRVNDNIYWTCGSDVGGRPGVYLGKISLSSLGPSFYAIETATFASPSLDIGFPSLTYAGQSVPDGSRTKEDLYIGFNFASPTSFPGIGCFYVSVDMEASDAVVGVEGKSNVRLTGTQEDPRNRWGDYSDVFYRGNPGEGFVVGYYTTPGGRNASYVAQFYVFAPVSTEPLIPAVQELKAYPNPAIDLIYFDFEVETAGTYEAYITDNLGRRIETLRKENLRPGSVSLSFNTAALSAGRYYVVVEGKGTKVLSKPFLVRK